MPFETGAGVVGDEVLDDAAEDVVVGLQEHVQPRALGDDPRCRDTGAG
jgi:hypothetical protein